jgi:putative ubiquitin-RnfH superfamily antitoxin RatB of RatAB toxin-antitoxin module
MADDKICVEVAYALPDKQKIISLEVPRGTTMFEAAERSGMTAHFEDLDLDRAPMGVFGKAEGNPRKRVLEEGERVEIYRPLIIDPKEVRKARAEKKKREQAGS